MNAGRVKGGQGNGRKGNSPRKNGGGFTGKCFKCGQVGHLKRDCQKKNGFEVDDAVFAAGEQHCDDWLIDSGTTSHMTPHRSDLFDHGALDAGPEFTIADGKKLPVTGKGTVRLTGLDGLCIKMVEVLHIPGLDRRLLLVGKLAERGMEVEFESSSCIIWSTQRAIAKGKKVGEAYILDCGQEEARLVEHAGVDTEWELWHARLGPREERHGGDTACNKWCAGGKAGH